MKDIFNKIKHAISMIVVGSIGIVIAALFLVLIFGFSISLFVIQALIKGVSFIKQSFEANKLRKEMLNEYMGKCNKQKDYAFERTASIQIVKDQDDNLVYADEFVPVDEEDINLIKNTIPKAQSDDLSKVVAYEAICDKITKEVSSSRLEELKQDLTYLSFELQDVASTHNIFIQDSNIANIHDKQKVFEKVKTMK